MMLGDNIEWELTLREMEAHKGIISVKPEPPLRYVMGCDIPLVGTFPGCSSKYYRINSETGAAEEISEAEYKAVVKL